MGSPDTIDLGALLTEIEGDSPGGERLRDDISPTSVFFQVKDAREAARAAERSVVWDDEEGVQGESPNWRPVLDLAPSILAERSKDLELCAWLTEALLREHGYAGLRDGLRVIRGLVERYWDHLHPMPDEDGMATRVAPLAGLNGEEAEGVLIAPIFSVPVTVDSSYRPMTIADYRRALELERIEDTSKREERVAQGAVSLAMFRTAVAETPPELLRETYEDLRAAREEFEALSDLLDERCGKGEDGYPLSPPSSNIRNALRECIEHFETFAEAALAALGEEEAESEDGGAIMAIDGEERDVTRTRVETREQAFQSLLQLAEFFKRTEPHSPVSYALEQAVRWGRMPLPDLLTEILPDQSSRDQLFRLVGIQPPSSEDY